MIRLDGAVLMGAALLLGAAGCFGGGGSGDGDGATQQSMGGSRPGLPGTMMGTAGDGSMDPVSTGQCLVAPGSGAPAQDCAPPPPVTGCSGCANPPEPGECPDLSGYCEAVCNGDDIDIDFGPGCPIPGCDCSEPGGGDLCSLPPESGDCEAAIGAWYFDTKTGQCEPFIYGGCGGNANNFSSPKDCEVLCGDDGAGGGGGDACDKGIDYGGGSFDVPACEGTMADGLCFEDSADACACLGCPDSCVIAESWPQQASCS